MEQSTLDIYETSQTFDEFYQRIQNHYLYLPQFAQQYEYIDLLGKGGHDYIEVNLYRSEIQLQEYAVKTFTFDKLFHDFKNYQVKDFVIETHVYDQLNQHVFCKNIVQMHGIFIEKNQNQITYNIVLQKTDGNTVKLVSDLQKKGKKPLTLKSILKIFEEQLIVLHSCEVNNITHRDIKPQNLLYKKEKNGQYISLQSDFGETSLKKNNILNQLQQTIQTMVKGTPIYLSPELFHAYMNGESDLKHNPFKSDLYSLAITIIVLATSSFSDRLSEDIKNLDPQNYKQYDLGPSDNSFIKQITQKINQIKVKFEKDKDIDKFINILSLCLIFNPNMRSSPTMILLNFFQMFKKVPKDVEKFLSNINQQQQQLQQQQQQQTIQQNDTRLQQEIQSLILINKISEKEKQQYIDENQKLKEQNKLVQDQNGKLQQQLDDLKKQFEEKEQENKIIKQNYLKLEEEKLKIQIEKQQLELEIKNLQSKTNQQQKYINNNKKFIQYYAKEKQLQNRLNFDQKNPLSYFNLAKFYFDESKNYKKSQYFIDKTVEYGLNNDETKEFKKNIEKQIKQEQNQQQQFKITEEQFENNYQIIQIIGFSQFGTINFQKNKNQIVQKFKKHDIYMQEIFLSKIFCQQQLQNRLNSQNIVKIENYIENQEYFNIISEFSTIGLDNMKKPLSPQLINLLIKHIIQILQELYQYGVAHRDIKPEMIIFFQEQNLFKLNNFSEVDLVIWGKKDYHINGTINYLSPEQLKMYKNGEQVLDTSIDLYAQDIYSAGITLLDSICDKKLSFNDYSQIQKTLDNIEAKNIYDPNVFLIISLMTSYQQCDRLNLLGTLAQLSEFPE